MTARAASSSRSASPSDRALPFNNLRRHEDDHSLPATRTLISNAALQESPGQRWQSDSAHRNFTHGDELGRRETSTLPSFASQRPERPDWQTLPPLASEIRHALPRDSSSPSLPSWAATGRMPPPRLSQSNGSPHPSRSIGQGFHPRTPRQPSPQPSANPTASRNSGRVSIGAVPSRPPIPGISADYPPPRQTRSRSNSLRRASSTDGYYGEVRPMPPQEPRPSFGSTLSPPMSESQQSHRYWDASSPGREEWGARSAPTSSAWGKLPVRERGDTPGSSGASYTLPPLSTLTDSLRRSSGAPGTQGGHRAAPAPPSNQFSSMVTVSQKRTWTDLANGERRDAIQKVLARYMRARAMRVQRRSGSRSELSEPEHVEDDFFVTIACSHSGVAQKSYGHEKRFLCPPPIVRLRGPGFTNPATSPDTVRHLRMSILPGGPESGGPVHPADHANQIVSEDIALDGTLQAKFGHLHVGGSTSNAKTFKLQLDMVKTVSFPSPLASAPHEHRFKSPRLSQSTDAPYGHGADRLDPSSNGNRLKTSQPQHPVMLRQHNWLSCESDAISVISKPSKKTTKAKTSSSQITPHLAICLFNRVNSQNVRTKYMAVDEGQLSARNDSWTTFYMRPLDVAGHSDHRLTDAVTYGSVVVLEVPGQGAVSDPLVVCKVEKGRIVVPAAFTDGYDVGPASMQASLSQGDSSEGPISQMQKVAFMRFESPRPRIQGPGGHYMQTPRGPRSFLCSAPPDPWWRPMGTQIPDMSSTPQHAHSYATAPMRPAASLSQRADLISPFHPQPSAMGSTDTHHGWGTQHSSSSSPHRTGFPDGRGDSDEPSVLRSSSVNRLGTNLPEALAPSPLTFLPAGRDESRSSGHSMKDQDVADDAFCWSVVGAAHFEYSFMRIGHTIEAEELPPPTDSPVGPLPRLLAPPSYLAETHSLRLKGENLTQLSTNYSRSPQMTVSFEAWLGSFGPLQTESVPPAMTRGSPARAPTLNVRLPLIPDLVNYAMSLENGVGPTAPGPPEFFRLPILLVREGDGVVCRSSFFVELFRIDRPGHGQFPYHASSPYGGPHQRYHSGEWGIKITS
ncbi:unnamed protein product [Sympodiomycopsis kandeliae]